MSNFFTPKRLMIIGTVFMVIGVLIPLLMTIDIIQSTLWLGFVTHGFQVVGIFLGFFGLFTHVRINRNSQ